MKAHITTLVAVGTAAILFTACNEAQSCSVEKGDNGDAVITCDDGSSTTVAAGTNGTNGTNGTSCTVTEANDTATITCPDGSTAVVTAGGGSTSGALPTASFAALSFPETDAEKREARASASLTLGTVTATTSYKVLLRSGDQPGGATGGTFGLLVDNNGNAVTAEDGSNEIANSTDFSSILTVGDKLFSVTHFESRPGAMYLTELQQNANSGELTAISTTPIDFSGTDGLWTPCAGSVTPWGTHLGGEEYPADARYYFSLEDTASASAMGGYTLLMLRYYGVDIWTDTNSDGAIDATMADAKAAFSPYYVGFPTEVSVAENGTATAVKHYSMARVAIELSYVMPDQKTVYITDDGTNVGFFMFIADTAGDLSSGRLYAMKWNQVSDVNGGQAEIEWIPLDSGSVTDAEVNTLIHSGGAGGTNIQFNDIFETEEPNADGSCPTSDFVAISRTSLQREYPSECLRLRTGMEVAASRLETTRYAAYLGATVELRKEEGITFDFNTNTMFVAMSAVEKGMEDNSSSDLGGPNHIRVPKNKCGTVYALPVAEDTTIGSKYVAQRWIGLVSGSKAANTDDNNSCDKDGIANPDNVTYITGTNTLIIGEDTGSGHQNDAVWAYDRASGALTRIMTTPYGSETTSPYWYSNINGWAYLKTVIQHPYGESDREQLTDAADARAYDGYLGPFRALP